MYLKRYEVRGFKNLTQSVVLENLGPINVLHGENNVGKSNVLQSIDWFFAVCELVHDTGSEAAWSSQEFPVPGNSEMAQRLTKDQVFNLESPRPIHWRGLVVIEQADLARFGLPADADREQEVSVELSARNHGHVAQFTINGDGQAPSLHRLVNNAFLRAALPSAPSAFALVDTWRWTRQDDPQHLLQQTVRSVLPDNRLLRLYDARESLDTLQQARWKSFERAMTELARTLGGGKFVLTYQRNRGLAILAYERGDVRIPAALLGSGIQQVAALLTQVATSDAAIVGIEEPELNLRYSLQLTLREMFASLVGGSRGVRQLFLTSHSPAFEHGDHFYWMRAGDGGPTVEKRPVRDAELATATRLGTLPEGRATMAYVTSEALTRVPESVVKALHLEGGRPVYFHKPSPDEPYQFLTEKQFFALWPEEPATASEEPSA